MRIGVFSDVHGNLMALEAVLADGEQLGVDTWVCLGDLAVRGPFPKEVLGKVRSLPNATVLVGNTDQWLIRGFPSGPLPPAEKRPLLDTFRGWAADRLNRSDLLWLETLPVSHTVRLGPERVQFVHASPRDTELVIPATADETQFAPLLEDPDPSIIIYGHIHIPFIRRIRSRTIANTGSVGLPFDGDPRASYLVLSDDGGAVSIAWRRVYYTVEDVVAAAQERGFPYADGYGEGLMRGLPA